jgi:hypothetical protein
MLGAAFIAAVVEGCYNQSIDATSYATPLK